MCNTLAVLRLSSNCNTYSSPTSECFPSLKFYKGLVVPSFPNLRPLELVFSDDPYWKVLAAFLQDISNICVHLSYTLPNRTKCDEDDSDHNPIDLYKPPCCVRSSVYGRELVVQGVSNVPKGFDDLSS
ncbi:unnamed protein product [Malus baccata var. baccata]